MEEELLAAINISLNERSDSNCELKKTCEASKIVGQNRETKSTGKEEGREEKRENGKVKKIYISNK